MTLPEVDVESTTTLGRWLPRKQGLKRFANRELLAVLMFGLFTGLAITLGEQVPRDFHWFGLGIVALSNLALGVAFTLWWEKSRAESRNRATAMRIDREIEEEILRISDNWQQTIHAVGTLVGKPDPEFIKAIQYILGNHQTYVASTLRSYALEIDGLGYSSRAFLKEKRERLTQVQTDVAEVLVGMPRDNGALIQIFSAVNPEAMERVLEGAKGPENAGLN